MKYFISLFILFSFYQTSNAFTLEEMTSKIKTQYWTNIDFVNDKGWNRIIEIQALRKDWSDSSVIVSGSKEVFNSNTWTWSNWVEQENHSNEWTIGEYNNEFAKDFPVIFKSSIDSLISEKKEDNYRQYYVNLMNKQFAIQILARPKYKPKKIVRFSWVGLPWVLADEVVVSNDFPTTKTSTTINSSWVWAGSTACPVGQKKDRYWKCVNITAVIPNSSTTTTSCKTWYIYQWWKCVLQNEKVADGVYNEEKLDSIISTVGIVIKKPTESSGVMSDIQKMSIDPKLLKDTKKVDIIPQTYCEWYSTYTWTGCQSYFQSK